MTADTNRSFTQIEISDPVAHEQYICQPREKVCQRELFLAPDFVPPDAEPTSSGSLTREGLGKQLINGLETIGIRESAVIPAGAIGNDTPIQSIREFWYSPRLGVNLISKRRDPRFGTQNFEVSEINLGDPDSQLFRV